MSRPNVTVRATAETLPYGAVSNDVTDGWGVIHVDRLEVVGDRLYATLDEALAVAADRRRRDDIEDRANRNFDEEVTVWGNDAGYLGSRDDSAD